MRLLKTRVLVIVAIVVIAIATTIGLGFKTGHDNPPTPQTGTPVTLPNNLKPLSAKTYSNQATATKQSVISFSNDSGVDSFLKANNLSRSDLQPVALLANTYVVNRAPDQLKTAGAQVSEQQHYTALLTPNDPIYPQWYTDKISAPAAWDLSSGSSSVIIADIDTGFALNHEDLSGRWAINSGEVGPTAQEGPVPNCTSRGLALDKSCNNLDNDGDGLASDWEGWNFTQGNNNPAAGATNPASSGATHGTETAGLLGATGNNAKGVASINWAAKILPLQALDDTGSGTTSNIASAIHYAVDQGAKVINMSLGSASPDPVLKAQLDYAANHDVVVVAAAGNCGDPSSFFLNGCSQVGQMLYPANYPQVLAIGATDANDNRASFSSYGPNLDVVAPGTGTIRTPAWSVVNQTSAYSTNISGTSFASPIVAGLSALWRGYHPSATATQTVNAVESSADKVAGMSEQFFNNFYGFGRVNAAASLPNSGANPPSPPPPPPPPPHPVTDKPEPARYNTPSRTDAAIYRPTDCTNGECLWLVRNGGNFRFGHPNDVQVPADYNGDGKSDIAIFRDGDWHIYAVGDYLGYGQAGDIPVPGDYNGDGRAEPAVFRPSQCINGECAWHIRGVGDFYFGHSGDIPVPADYNGDGRTDIAVFRPSTGDWHIYAVGDFNGYGQNGDIPVPGDYNGDGRAEAAVFRPSQCTNGECMWHIRGVGDFAFGHSSDTPLTGDFNDDGRADITVYRPSTGDWHIRAVGDFTPL